MNKNDKENIKKDKLDFMKGVSDSLFIIMATFIACVVASSALIITGLIENNVTMYLVSIGIFIISLPASIFFSVTYYKFTNQLKNYINDNIVTKNDLDKCKDEIMSELLDTANIDEYIEIKAKEIESKYKDE